MARVRQETRSVVRQSPRLFEADRRLEHGSRSEFATRPSPTRRFRRETRRPIRGAERDTDASAASSRQRCQEVGPRDWGGQEGFDLGLGSPRTQPLRVLPHPRAGEETTHRPRQVTLAGQCIIVMIEWFVAAAATDPAFKRLPAEPFPPTDRQYVDLVVADRRPISSLGELDDPVRLVDV